MSNNKYSDKDMSSDGTIDGMCNCSTCKDERKRGVGGGYFADPSEMPGLKASDLPAPPPSIEPIKPRMKPKDVNVEKSPHYQFGKDGEYEVFKVLDAWGLWNDAALFNVIKYVARARHKGRFLEDLKKARVYLDQRIKMEEGEGDV